MGISRLFYKDTHVALLKREERFVLTLSYDDRPSTLGEIQWRWPEVEPIASYFQGEDSAESDVPIGRLNELVGTLTDLKARCARIKKLIFYIQPEVWHVHIQNAPLPEFILTYQWGDGKLKRVYPDGVVELPDGWYRQGDLYWCYPTLSAIDQERIRRPVIEKHELLEFLQRDLSAYAGTGVRYTCELHFDTIPALELVIELAESNEVRIRKQWNAPPEHIDEDFDLDGYVVAGRTIRPGIRPEVLALHLKFDGEVATLRGIEIARFLDEHYQAVKPWITSGTKQLEAAHVFLKPPYEWILVASAEPARCVGQASAQPVALIGGEEFPAPELVQMMRVPYAHLRCGWVRRVDLLTLGVDENGKWNGRGNLKPMRLTPAQIVYRGDARLNGPWIRMELRGAPWCSSPVKQQAAREHLEFLTHWGIPGGITGGYEAAALYGVEMLNGLLARDAKAKILIVGEKVDIEEFKAQSGSYQALYLSQYEENHENTVYLAPFDRLSGTRTVAGTTWGLLLLIEPDALYTSGRKAALEDITAINAACRIGFYVADPAEWDNDTRFTQKAVLGLGAMENALSHLIQNPRAVAPLPPPFVFSPSSAAPATDSGYDYVLPGEEPKGSPIPSREYRYTPFMIPRERIPGGGKAAPTDSSTECPGIRSAASGGSSLLAKGPGHSLGEVPVAETKDAQNEDFLWEVTRLCSILKWLASKPEPSKPTPSRSAHSSEGVFFGPESSYLVIAGESLKESPTLPSTQSVPSGIPAAVILPGAPAPAPGIAGSAAIPVKITQLSAIAGGTSAAGFTRDARRFASYEGAAYAVHVPFFYNQPKHSDMSIRQRDWYFHLRDRLRRGDYPDTDLSYLYVRFFELINVVACESAASAYREMMAIWLHYRDRHPNLDRYLPDWTFDFVCLKKPGVGAWEYMKAAPLLTQTALDTALTLRTAGEPLVLPVPALEVLSGFRFTQSKFYLSGHDKLMAKVLPQVIASVDARVRKRVPGGLLVEFAPKPVTYYRTAFQNAIVEQPVQYTLVCAPYCANGLFRGLVSQMLNYAENVLRIQCGFEEKLHDIKLDNPYSDWIDEFITGRPTPKRATQQASRIALDEREIEKLRGESDEVRDALIASMEQEELEAACDIQAPARPADTPEGLLTDLEPVNRILHALTEDQRRILEHFCAKGWALDAEACAKAFPTLLMDAELDAVNTQSLRYLSAQLIVREGNLFTVADDYRDELEYLIENPMEHKPNAWSVDEEGLDPEWINFYHAVDLDALGAVLAGNGELQHLASSRGAMPDLLVDALNTAAMETVGDLVVDGEAIMEEYLPLITRHLRKA